jgi:ribosomal protein L7/L12
MSQMQFDEISALKVRVAELEEKVEFLFHRLNLSFTQSDGTETADAMSDITALIRQGNKIQAIKLLRDRTGMGLKEAKDAVEDMERRLK